MPIIRPVTKTCSSCKKSFTRMQGDLVLPTDINPYCTVCTGRKAIGLSKKLKDVFKGKRRQT